MKTGGVFVYLGGVAAILIAGCAASESTPNAAGNAGAGGGAAGRGGAAGNAGNGGTTGGAGNAASGTGGAGTSGGTGGAGGGAAGSGGPAGAAAGGAGGTGGGAAATGGGAAGGRGGAGGAGATGGLAGGSGGAGGTVGLAGRGGGSVGGAGGLAGTVGTGGAAGWPLGGSSLCAGAPYVVCEDFEATAAGATPAGDWTLPGSNYGTGTIAVAADVAARGSHALKVTIPAGGSSVERYLQRRNITALASGHFGRLFFRIQGPTTTAFVHWDLILGAGPYMGQTRRVRWGVTGTGVGATSSSWAWIYNIEQGDTGVEARTAHPTLDSWMCVEWQWDAANQRIRFYFNGTEAQALHVDGTLPNGTALQVPTFSTLSFGLAKYQSTTADLVFWIDEIALDTQRIGCGG